MGTKEIIIIGLLVVAIVAQYFINKQVNTLAKRVHQIEAREKQ